MDNEITVQEELESTAAEIPADAVEESETEAAPGEGSQAEELQQLRAEIMELRLKLALLTGGAANMSQLFSRRQSRSTNVATFLALLELIRGGRVTLDEQGGMTMHCTARRKEKP